LYDHDVLIKASDLLIALSLSATNNDNLARMLYKLTSE